MTDLTSEIKDELIKYGADIVGFGNLNELPTDVRDGLPVGVSIAVVYPKKVIRGITHLPTIEYREWYDKINERLDMVVSRGAEYIHKLGYKAIAQTREHVGSGENEDSTTLPHKTVATCAGIGWIGKCATLVTREYGSAVRLGIVLTNAPVECGTPIIKSQCPATCRACVDICPGQASKNMLWEAGIDRDEFFDAKACEKGADKIAKIAKPDIPPGSVICGLCISNCPFTKKALGYK